jgi:hypothetical protein
VACVDLTKYNVLENKEEKEMAEQDHLKPIILNFAKQLMSFLN